MLQLLDLLDQASQIVGHGGIGAVGHYVVLRFPSLLAGAVPLGVLAGALLCFMRLAASAEMIALRATGSSLWRVVSALLPSCALLAVLQVSLQAEIAPRTARALSTWWQRTLPPPPPGPPGRPGSGDATWLRIGAEIVSASSVSTDGRTLDRVMIVHRAAGGDLLDRIDAAQARFADRRWTLRDGTITRPDGAVPQRFGERAWPDGPSPANMVEVARPVGSVPAERLLGILHGRWASAHGPLAARTALDALVMGLFDPLLMVLLAAPLLLAPPRRGVDGLRILRVIGLGLGFLGLAGLLAAMGDSGTLPPLLASVLPVLLFGGLGLVAVLQADAA